MVKHIGNKGEKVQGKIIRNKYKNKGKNKIKKKAKQQRSNWRKEVSMDCAIHLNELCKIT